MYVRKDVFEQLGLTVPKTWNEFLRCASVIMRNNLSVGVPQMYTTFLYQYNGILYNKDLTATNLKSKEAIEAFEFFTDLYCEYKLPVTFSFYNRFRTGTAPLGIAGYTTYNQLTQAAPEIQGRWKICAIPGIMQEDGTINRSIAGSGTGCSVVKASSSKEDAWQFLCWWTSADTQLRYNNNVESILGAVSRTATANVEAFSSYSWNADDLEILRAQWDCVQELPEVPGGYYVARAVDQAYWAVLNGNDNEKDAMLEWGKVSDNEIARKIAEYSKK
jgi:ABC-type glycerol-3-phosphate transport system substrate-binding protein